MTIDLDADRKRVIATDRLWHLVENAAKDARTRAGAAIALGPTLDGEDRTRLRRVAGASASPALRVALETAADDEAELGALENALTELDVAPRRTIAA